MIGIVGAGLLMLRPAIDGTPAAAVATLPTAAASTNAIAGVSGSAAGTSEASGRATASPVASASTVPSPSPKQKLGLYFDTLTAPSKLATDADEIPMVAYSGVLQYNPVSIIQQALAYYDQWYAHQDAEARRLFLKLSDWLVTKQKPDGLWEYTFEFDRQPLPWWSALAQGQALSLMARAYQETGDERYRASMRQSLVTFLRPQTDRGVRFVENGYTWFEEYMPPHAPHTLNGFMWALGGLRDMVLAFDDPTAKQLWDDGMRTLLHDLPRFDNGEWSCYSVRWPNLDVCNPATKYYQKLHVYLLKIFYGWTGEPIFKTYADRWEAEIPNPPPYA